MQQQKPDLESARESFTRSLRLRPNPIAARCLAVSAPTVSEAAGNFSLAWKYALEQAIDNKELLTTLSSEIAAFYLSLTKMGAVTGLDPGSHLDSFLTGLDADDVPEEARRADAVLFARASRAVSKGNCDLARTIIRSSRFPTFFSVLILHAYFNGFILMNVYWQAPRTKIGQLWLACAMQDEEKRVGRPLSSIERHRLRLSSQAALPANIGPFHARTT